MAPLMALRAQPAAYISETDYFEADWQTAFWGEHHPRLARIKARYDPEGLFFVHHSGRQRDMERGRLYQGVMAAPLNIAPNQIALVAADLDGTLLRSDGTISPRTQAAIHAAQGAGIKLVFVTGRPPRVVRDLVNAAGVHGIAICANGAILYDVAAGEFLHHERLAADLALGLIAALRAADPQVSFATEHGHRLGHEAHFPAIFEEVGNLDITRIDHAHLLCDEDLTRLLVHHPTEAPDALAARINTHLAGRAEVTHSGGPFVEIGAVGRPQSQRPRPAPRKAWASPRARSSPSATCPTTSKSSSSPGGGSRWPTPTQRCSRWRTRWTGYERGGRGGDGAGAAGGRRMRGWRHVSKLALAASVKHPLRAQRSDLSVVDLAAEPVTDDDRAGGVLDEELIVALAEEVPGSDKPPLRPQGGDQRGVAWSLDTSPTATAPAAFSIRKSDLPSPRKSPAPELPFRPRAATWVKLAWPLTTSPAVTAPAASSDQEVRLAVAQEIASPLELPFRPQA